MSQTGGQYSCVFCGAGLGGVGYGVRSIFGDSYTLDRCQACGAVSLCPTPTSEQQAEAYSESYYGQRPAKFSPIIEAVIDIFRQGRARRVHRLVPTPARVLDIGCGNGRFLGYMIDRGYEGYGVELSGKAADRASRVPGLHLKTGELAKDDFDAGFFDVVSLWHVIEHLSNPREMLTIMQKVLKPSGYLMLSLPNIDSLQSKVFGGNWFHLDPPRHVCFLGKRTLTAALAQRGFRLVQARHFSLEQNVFGIQQSILNAVCRERDVLFEAIKGNRAYTARYSSWNIAMQKLFWLGTSPLCTLAAMAEAAVRAGGTMELTFQKVASLNRDMV